MWRRPLYLLRSITFSRQSQSYPPQFSTFCDSCRLKVTPRPRQFHSSSANLGKHSKNDDDDDDDEEEEDDDDDVVREDSVRSELKSNMKGKQASAFKNESIPVSAYTQLRVVYKDKDTGVSKWELLRKVDAIALARKMGLDLLLVDANGNPPVCKLDNFGQVMMAQKKKEKAAKESSKAIKEMYIKVGIDPHDLGVKMNKIKVFLSAGHQVKISVLSTKKSRSRSQALTLPQTALAVMEALQALPITILQLPSRARKQDEPSPQAPAASEGDDEQEDRDGDEDGEDGEEEEEGDRPQSRQQQQQQQAASSSSSSSSPDTPPPPRPVYQMEFMVTPKKAAAAAAS